MTCIRQQSYAFSSLVTLCCIKDTKGCSSKHPEVRSGRHGKADCYRCCIRDEKRVSQQTEDPTGKHKHLSTAHNMASIAVLIGGALANALAFTGSSYLFSRLSKDIIDKERKRHNKVIKKLQKVQIE